ncbi:MAG: hypothetical protein JSS81_13360 [Acidobacteria bacterium]|nr:hypothetical protein [Acidobacteriota bacterium]
MRALQLERVKREANKKALPEPDQEQIVKLAEIKEDFEGIQKLENEIVKAYTTGKTINYGKIEDSAARISKKALRLDANLFGSPADDRPEAGKRDEKKKKGVRELIIELDGAIGNFVRSPIFSNGKLVDSKVSEKSQSDLRKIIKISEALSEEAKKNL